MGAACQSCNGMGRLEDGSDCPECVGGQTVEREPVLVGAETVLPARTVADLPPSTATPDGTIPATTTSQGGFTPPEAIKVPSTVELVAEPEPLGAPSAREDVSLEDVPVSQGGTGGAPAAEAEESDYESYTVDELQAELESRGLPKSGTKAELIARLEEDDAG